METDHEFLRGLRSGLNQTRVREAHVIVAVSGGPDSVALLRGLVALSQEFQLTITVAHFNHRFRGAEADADARFVEHLSASRGLKCIVQAASAGSVSVREASARHVRYQFLESVTQEERAAVIATLLVVALSIYLVNNILVHPLRGLLGMADQIGQGKLAARTDLTGEDEIGRLGQAFNHMAEDLSKLYQNLEARVEEKTAELTIANRSLELLYHSIARLYNGPVAPATYAILLKDLETVLGVGHGMACLVEAGETRARVIASTLHPEHGDADLCGLMSCAECLAHPTLAVHPMSDGRRVLSLPLRDTEHHYGVLQLEMPPGKELAQWQTQLLDALSRHIGIAIGTARRTEQHRRLSLLEERAALARDLHDSLAQSLTYMKIQVSRLKPLVDSSGAGSEAGEVLTELREGLNSAYRQLRELLTTFRLRIEGEGLATALQNTVTEFSGRGGIPISLDVHLAGCTLTPNEEIHALQILREALSNVLNHAQARHAEVSVSCGSDGSVTASVTDDGSGIHETAGAHHYGMTIMEERAKHLGGQLTVENLPTLGTRVTLHFMPGTRHEAAILVSPVHPT
ncbi:MAG: histidine kinase [Hydrogenophilales bacterium 12-63-5]|nr:MAG: histidine kinase [Hydrogenophilales bacterium 12-63-5]